MNYSVEELRGLGVQVEGECHVHRTVQFFRPERIVLRHGCRLDCFAVLSAGDGGIDVGEWAHVGIGVCVHGAGGQVSLGSGASLAAHCVLYTNVADLHDGHLASAALGTLLPGSRSGSVCLEDEVVCGASAVILPGVTLGFGAVVGALSLVKKNVRAGDIVGGIPARPIRRRNIHRLRQARGARGRGDG